MRGPKPTARHGTRSRYVNGKCRCQECVEANRLYTQDRRTNELETKYLIMVLIIKMYGIRVARLVERLMRIPDAAKREELVRRVLKRERDPVDEINNTDYPPELWEIPQTTYQRHVRKYNPDLD